MTLVEMKISSVEYFEYDNQKYEQGFMSWIRSFLGNFLAVPSFARQHTARVTIWSNWYDESIT